MRRRVLAAWLLLALATASGDEGSGRDIDKAIVATVGLPGARVAAIRRQGTEVGADVGTESGVGSAVPPEPLNTALPPAILSTPKSSGAVPTILMIPEVSKAEVLQASPAPGVAGVMVANEPE